MIDQKDLLFKIPFLKNLRRAVGLFIVLLVIFILFSITLTVVPAGHVGVMDFFGRAFDRELQPGLQFKIPFARVVAMSTQTNDYTMTSRTGEGQIKADDSINVLTKEGLTVNLDITALYHIIDTEASEIYKKIGKEYESKILRPTIRSSIRGVVAQFDANALYSEKREEAGQKILENIKAQLNQRGFAVEDVLIRNVVLPQKLADAIEEKLRAEQEAQRFDFILAKEQKEAERKRIEAQGQRDAQKIINESLTERYLQYQYIQGLKERAGTIYVPVSPENGLPMFKGL
ncbi:MAG: Band 7 protein [Parcubacteria group bacterium GW2011_GWC2_44_17]|uniref:Band 7 domain-containing protein n=1 Tax=Candidatus Jacksonbacteria bacterium RIFCSPLOWO2_02_FULL_44_20 TaxID=1798460 RepID=A0A1G2A611_9BACT|nr:MAG: Band 7 protein [Parcubacteria group bacterium GW2011_GWC2_44_17]KKT50497.1 MAG: Band 7 protein [Parcubacteria group bacterium GW2011_GWF2_44_17]OGY71427.1 MAG: hypothetical protein A3C00_04025 [Candidatus Jacksonbacteria bacterium RIFCSPHIGHO2_02_FULL_44_25]OGY72189.1 MAG: hypothetical protein A3E05_01330 [Candidatus Jacksonbacteria bacterium RIFCSPHIGHO2_12_FULL_44_12]OGY72308.1 MAG: hypothetical protein A3H61_00815 [Candidatus Jacksonbacteria bacterium RIFCSPLOWO2_02_FULL_44_20]OGY73